MRTKRSRKMRFKIAISLVVAGIITISVGIPSMLKAAEKKAGIVAVVNGAEIPVEDFNGELNRVQRAIVATGKPLSSPQLARLRTEVAEGLVTERTVRQRNRLYQCPEYHEDYPRLSAGSGRAGTGHAEAY
jgi:hypothetical protein